MRLFSRVHVNPVEIESIHHHEMRTGFRVHNFEPAVISLLDNMNLKTGFCSPIIYIEEIIILARKITTELSIQKNSRRM